MLLLTYFENQNNKINIYDKIVGGNLKEIIKKIKLEKNSQFNK